MANNNTINRYFSATLGGLGADFLKPSSNAVAGSTETAVSLTNGPVAKSVGGGVAILNLEDAGYLNTVNGALWQYGQPFRLRSSGVVVTGTSATLTIKLYQIPAAIIAAGTTVVSDSQTFTGWNVLNTYTVSAAIATTSAAFYTDAILQWDGLAHLQGTASGNIQSTINTSTEITSTSVTSSADLNFAITYTLSSANAANVVSFDEFAIEQI